MVETPTEILEKSILEKRTPKRKERKRKSLIHRDLRRAACSRRTNSSQESYSQALDKHRFMGYIIAMETIMISPTKKASQRTKNRIREHGPVFRADWMFDHTHGADAWLLRSGEWFGWLPRNEFHVECVGKKFIEKVLG